MKINELFELGPEHETVCDESLPMPERLAALVKLEQETGILNPSTTDQDVLFYVQVMNSVF